MIFWKQIRDAKDVRYLVDHGMFYASSLAKQTDTKVIMMMKSYDIKHFRLDMGGKGHFIAYGIHIR